MQLLRMIFQVLHDNASHLTKIHLGREAVQGIVEAIPLTEGSFGFKKYTPFAKRSSL
jgi:hypothetical protein